MNLLLYRTLCGVSMAIVVYATIHLVMAGGSRGAPNFLLQIDGACALLVGAGYFMWKQRAVDWLERPEKLRKLRLAKPLFGMGILLLLIALGASLYDRFWATSLVT
jgi:uncharacterized iron-regulated membrane protein